MTSALALLPIAAANISTEEVHRAQCASNLRQAALALHIIASESQGRLPSANGGGGWMWDVRRDTANSIAMHMPWQRLYCPGAGYSSSQIQLLWEFGNFRVLGYAPTLPESPGIIASNVNQTIFPQPIRIGLTVVAAQPAAERVLWADATISRSGQDNESLRHTYSYTGIQGSSTHRTPHLDGAVPLGGNLAMLDGHVEWRPFSEMHVRGSGSSSGPPPPVYWW